MATCSPPSTLDNIPVMTPPNEHPLRRVLGDVSPNVKPSGIPNTIDSNNKPTAGSPLKRGFNAMGGSDNAGLTYLKRRRLSGDATLSDVNEESILVSRRVFRPVADDDSLRFRPLLQQDETAVPVVLQTPTEPNTPSDKTDNPPSSQDRKSFSSLINYDPSSQPSNLQPSNPQSATPAAKSRAELLKMKLQVAMFKVKTNQVDVQFADLRVSDPATPPKSTAEAVEAAVAQLRREGQEALERQRKRREVREAQQGTAATNVSTLPPAPALLPTAYSSRKIYTRDVPSSPPAESPERSASRSADRQYELEAELTSSVVKGRVAEGLLGLRHGL